MNFDNQVSSRDASSVNRFSGRHARWRELLMAQDAFDQATGDFWREQGLVSGHIPVTTGAVSSPMGLGSDSTPVSVVMNGRDTYLADSMQFLLECLTRMAPNGAFYVMPSFRGEEADETHLPEFFHSEAEIPGTLSDVQRVVEKYIRHVTGVLVEACKDNRSLTVSQARAARLLEDPRPFHSVTFDQAVELLRDVEDAVFVSSDQQWRSLTRSGERALMSRLGEFTWVTNWDHLSVPFYQAFAPNGRALNADLLFGPGEVVGAGQRHSDADSVLRALGLHQVSAEQYDWYVELRRLSPLQTAGFGLGVERYFMWLFDVQDIRELQLFVRQGKGDEGP